MRVPMFPGRSGSTVAMQRWSLTSLQQRIVHDWRTARQTCALLHPRAWRKPLRPPRPRADTTRARGGELGEISLNVLADKDVWRRLRIGRRSADVPQRGLSVSRYRDIAEGDDAHDLAILLHDGQATDGLFADESHGVTDAGRGRNGRELAAADLSQRHRGGIAPLREHADHDVTIGHDAAQVVVLEDDHVSDVALPHELGGIHDGGGGIQSLGIAGHDVTNALLLRDPCARRRPSLPSVYLSLIHDLSPLPSEMVGRVRPRWAGRVRFDAIIRVASNWWAARHVPPQARCEKWAEGSSRTRRLGRIVRHAEPVQRSRARA